MRSDLFSRLSALLQAIERGSVRLHADRDPSEDGLIEYTTQDGWRLVIFNDASSWDYLESVTSPEGETMDRQAYCEARGDDPDYSPDAKVSWLAYGIPTLIGGATEARRLWGAPWLTCGSQARK